MYKFRMPVLATALTSLLILLVVSVAGSVTGANAVRELNPRKPVKPTSTTSSPSSSPTSSPTSTPTSAPTYTVPTSIAGDCSVDVSSALVSWIGSVPDNSTLVFGDGACYRVERTLEFRGRAHLAFLGNGATFRSFNAMTSGTYADDQRAMWRVIGSVGIRFDNMTLTGAYQSGGSFDSGLQHAHGLDVRGSSVQVSHVNASNVAGDCFMFGLGYDNVTRSSGSVRDSTCSATGRSGVSVTAGNNIAVSSNTFEKIGFTAVNLEPNVGSYTASTGWGTSGVTVSGNAIGNYGLYAFSVVENAPNTNIFFTGNTVTASSGLRIGVVAPGGSVRPSNITITGNSATTATWSPALEIQNVDGLTATSNTVPMSRGTMATVDRSCGVDVSGNSYPGGSSQVAITNPAC